MTTCCWASTRSSPSRSRPTPRLRARVWTIAPPPRTASRPRAAGSWTTSPPAPAPPTSRGSTAPRSSWHATRATPPASCSSVLSCRPPARRSSSTTSRVATPTPGTPRCWVAASRTTPTPGGPSTSRRRTTRPPAPSRPVPITRTPWSTSPTTSTASTSGPMATPSTTAMAPGPTTPRGSRGPRPSATSRA